MNVWILRSPDRSRFRIEINEHPGVLLYHGWEARQGEMDEAAYQRLCASTDTVEIERLHQELWARLTPAT